MNEATAIVLWRGDIGYVVAQHRNIVVESPTKIRVEDNEIFSELTSIEYLDRPYIRWQEKHFIEAIIPWSGKIGYYKNKIVASISGDAVEILHAWTIEEIDYFQVLSLLHNLTNTALANKSNSSFELLYRGARMHTSLNLFIKILGPSEILNLPQYTLFGLTLFQWEDQWIPLIEPLATEHKYIGIAQHSRGVWALPMEVAPKLVPVPAQPDDVLVQVVNLLQAQHQP